MGEGSAVKNVVLVHGGFVDRSGWQEVYNLPEAGCSSADQLETGDAVKAFGPQDVRIQALEQTELILIDVPQRYEPSGVWAR